MMYMLGLISSVTEDIAAQDFYLIKYFYLTFFGLSQKTLQHKTSMVFFHIIKCADHYLSASAI